MRNITEQIRLIRTSAAYLDYQLTNHHDNSRYEGDFDIIAVLETQYNNYLHGTLPDDSFDTFYLELLKAAKVDASSFSMTRNSSGRMTMLISSVFTSFQALKFYAREIFNLVMSSDMTRVQYFSNYADNMAVFLKNLSRLMTTLRITMLEAISKLLDKEDKDYFYQIKQDDIDVLLSPEAKIQLYLHARQGLIIGTDEYDSQNPDNDALRANAKFHVDHPEPKYLQADHDLASFGFSLRETNDVLHHYNQTIDTLHTKLQGMDRDALIKMFLNDGLIKFAPSLNAATLPTITETVQMNQSSTLIPLRTPGISFFPAFPLISNVSSLQVVEAGILTVIALACICLKPKVLTVPFNLMLQASNRMLGNIVAKDKTESEETQALQPSHPVSLNNRRFGGARAV